MSAGAGTKGNQIEGNWIGTDSTGAKSLGNQAGVVVEQGRQQQQAWRRGQPSVPGRAWATSFPPTRSRASCWPGRDHRQPRRGERDRHQQHREERPGQWVRRRRHHRRCQRQRRGGVNGSLLFFSPGNLISGTTTMGSSWTPPAPRTTGCRATASARTGRGPIPGHLGNGVVLTRGANANFIGGDSAGAGNLISGNQKSGVVVNLGATANVVQHDTIGTIRTGFGALGNLKDGVDLFSSGNTVADDLIFRQWGHRPGPPGVAKHDPGQQDRHQCFRGRSPGQSARRRLHRHHHRPRRQTPWAAT